MNKQQALKQLQDLVNKGFAFYVGRDHTPTYQGDKILSRVYNFVRFSIDEVLYEGDLFNNYVYSAE